MIHLRRSALALLLLVSLLTGFSLAWKIKATAVSISATPGSSEDPLVTKSYVDTISPSSTVIIVNGWEGTPDALAAASLVKKFRAPLLYTQKTALPSSTLSALTTYRPAKVYVIGGPVVISDQVVNQIASTVRQWNGSVERIWGQGRDTTAVEIMKKAME